MKINGQDLTQNTQESNVEEAVSQKKSPNKKAILIVVVVILSLAVTAGLAVGIRSVWKSTHPSTVSMSSSTPEVQDVKKSKKNSSVEGDNPSGGILSESVAVKNIDVDDNDLGYRTSVISYIPGYKTDDGKSAILVEFKSTPNGSLYASMDVNYLKLKINGEEVSSSTDFNRSVTSLGLDVYSPEESSSGDVEGWLAYPVDNVSGEVDFVYSRDSVSLDSSAVSDGEQKPAMTKEFKLYDSSSQK